LLFCKGVPNACSKAPGASGLLLFQLNADSRPFALLFSTLPDFGYSFGMIQNSFVHLPGIGAGTEDKFWSLGIHTWDDLDKNLNTLFKGARAEMIATALDEGRQAVEAREFSYFQGKLKGNEMWRLLPAFLGNEIESDIAYLDIETTGLGFPPQCQSTTIAVLFRGELHLEHDRARKAKLLRDVHENAKLLVTFNGGTFDLPFLRREFNLELRHPHLDLRFWLARLGFKGGLKAIQKSFEEVPQREDFDIDGYDAVRLWNLHRRGVANALETLFTYNAEDTLVLEHLAYCGLNIEADRRKHLGLKTYALPEVREIPYSVCEIVYGMLR
jgi:uncharacterized protein